MFDRASMQVTILSSAVLLAIASVLLGLTAAYALIHGAGGSPLCLHVGQDICAQAFTHPAAYLGRFHLVAVHLTVHGLAVASLIAMVGLSGIGHRDGTRYAMHMATVCGIAAGVGALVWAIQAHNVVLTDGRSTPLDSRLVVALLATNALLAVAVAFLHVTRLPDVWPWPEEYLATRDKVIGFAIGAVVLLAMLTGTGFRLQAEANTAPAPMADPISPQKLAETLDLPNLLPCDNRALVRPPVLAAPPLLPAPHLGSPGADPALALFIDWQRPDRLKSLWQWAGGDLERWLHDGHDVIVLYVANDACPTRSAASPSMACTLAAASHCVARTSRATWLPWILRMEHDPVGSPQDVVPRLRASGLRDAAACLEDEMAHKFVGLEEINKGVASVSTWLRSDGRCPDETKRLTCLNGSLGLLIGYDGPPIGPRDLPAGLDADAAVRSCLRQLSHAARTAHASPAGGLTGAGSPDAGTSRGSSGVDCVPPPPTLPGDASPSVPSGARR